MLTIQRILAPIDFSECSRAALEVAAGLAQRFDAELVVLHVWEAPVYSGVAGLPDLTVQLCDEPPSTRAEFERSRAGRELDRMLAAVDRTRVNALKRVDVGDACEAIVRAAESGGHDLIVMGTHARSGLSHLVMGSVAEQVLRRAPCPVLIVRCTECVAAAQGGAAASNGTARSRK
jgi:universal stress protein A